MVNRSRLHVDAVAEAAHLAEDLCRRTRPSTPRPSRRTPPGRGRAGTGPAWPAPARRRSAWRCRRGPCRAATAPRSPACAGGGSVRRSGLLEGVAEVQRAGDVGRRDDDAEAAALALLVGLEVAALDPSLVQRRLYLRGHELRAGSQRRGARITAGGLGHPRKSGARPAGRSGALLAALALARRRPRAGRASG